MNQNLQKIPKVIHLTSAHPRSDIRIFQKQCKSLLKSMYSVHLVVADNLGDEKKDGIIIHDVGKQGGRFSRLIGTTRRVLKKAKSLDGDIYHLHDPELIWIGLVLLKNEYTVIFDSHEDVPLQILNKPYMTPLILKLISKFYAFYEYFACRKFSGIITATPFIKNKFKKINPFTVAVCNYPIIEEFVLCQNWSSKPLEVCYVGGLSNIRGIKQLVEAMELVNNNISLNLVGSFSEPSMRKELIKISGWKRINELGEKDRDEVSNIYLRSRVGLVTLLPIPNYLDSLPIKMFEYMCAGIPVIASDFPLWRKIIIENKCGICINPKNPKEIASAINFLITNPEKAEEMGQNGRQTILTKYNWLNEEKVLFNFYQEIIFNNRKEFCF